MQGTPALQILVTVSHRDVAGKVDVYIYDNITSVHPIQRFKLTGLNMGDARISGYNTVMTAEIDVNSTLNKGKAPGAMTRDLFREFAWSTDGQAFVQVAFPGIFPDLTRYQAEQDQARINAGHDSWKNDPARVAKALESQFLKWQRPVTTKLLSGGGQRDLYATVQVQEAPIQGARPTIIVTLSRLEGNTHNFWVVIGVTDGTDLTLKNIEPRSLLTSPVTLEGTGLAFEAVIGQAVVYDHLYTDIGHAQIIGSNGMGKVSYSIQVPYASSFNGVQEGIVTVYQDNGGLSSENVAAVMTKVLLNPAPGVVLGPLPCPAAVRDASYWNQFVSVPPDIEVADSVSCGNLLGKPSLQAVVVTREIVGGGPVFRSVFVFDKITDPKPQLLFKITHLLHGNAQISGYSTIMTAEADNKSSINTGKREADLTVDLFREFAWNAGTGTFVQVVFPGIFPDLTRYQAEADQGNVSQGHDTWKNDAAQTAQRMAAQMLQWSSMQTKVLSGGSAQDVDAVVQVQHLAGIGKPSMTVTLSRLEGDTHNIWMVIGVQSDLTITSPANKALLNSPVTVKGSGNAFEGQVGILRIQDHLYNEIGKVEAHGIDGMGPTTFTATLPYRATFSGTQEGLLTLYSYSAADGKIIGAVMLKVLISA